MRKKDIVNIILAQAEISKNEKLLQTVRDRHYGERPERYWYPNIPELKPYFDILKKEIIFTKQETEKAKKLIEESKCTHEVRIKYYDIFSSSCECVLCQKHPSISFFSSSYINDHTVTFEAKYQEDEYGGIYEIPSGKTIPELRETIMQMLEKYEDDDEVDLVEEFSKLKLQNVEINTKKRKEENYILIIGGTNLKYVEEDVYIKKKYYKKSMTIFEYFLSLLNTKVAYIENRKIIDSCNYNNCKIYLNSYETKEELIKKINKLKDIPFKLIIDLSEIYDFKIENSLKIAKCNLNLREIFPNSKIVKISTNQIKKEDGQTLTDMLEECDFSLIDDLKGNYSYTENGEVITEAKDKTLIKIKRMIKK